MFHKTANYTVVDSDDLLEIEDERQKKALDAYLHGHGELRRAQKPGMFVSGTKLCSFFASILIGAALFAYFVYAMFSLGGRH